jgi:hypothetical protein
MGGLGFEWTIKLCDLLTIAGALFVVATLLHKRGGQEAGMQVTLQALAHELKELKEQFKAFSDTLTQVATQEVKINLLMKWYDELRRGDGFIRGSRGIEREYADDPGHGE